MKSVIFPDSVVENDLQQSFHSVSDLLFLYTVFNPLSKQYIVKIKKIKHNTEKSQ